MTVRRRLVRSTVFIALAAVLVLGIPLVVVETARVGTDQAFRLEREADVVGGVIDEEHFEDTAHALDRRDEHARARP